MNYRTREGIILTRICEMYILVAPSRFRHLLKRAVHINETAAEIWQLLKDHKTNDQIKEYFLSTYDNPDEVDIDDMIRSFEDSMFEKGYLGLAE